MQPERRRGERVEGDAEEDEALRASGELDDEDTSCTPFVSPGLFGFAIIMNIWAVLMLEYWKRKEATTAMRWGMSDFETRETDRPEYFGELISSPVNGQRMVAFPTAKRTARQLFALIVTVGMLLLVMGLLLHAAWLLLLAGCCWSWWGCCCTRHGCIS